MIAWKIDIIEALKALGGAGIYEEIYAETANRRLLHQDSLPPSWKSIVRRTIQDHSSDSISFDSNNDDLFRSVDGLGKGAWALRDDAATEVRRRNIAEDSEASQGYARQSAVRSAIESHAVGLAIKHYQNLGATDIKELGKPYDLRLTLRGREIHVEVKGSLRSLSAVSVTKNEVAHARETPGTQLFVVDSINLTTLEDGTLVTDGGSERIWLNWAPADESLIPLTYSHILR